MKRAGYRFTLPSLLAVALLAGCGAGTPEPEAPPSVATSCSQDFTWLDLVRKSGNLIGSGVEGEWTWSCPIRQLQTARLTVCVSHQDITELQIVLTRPDGTRKTLPALASWNTDTTCPPTAGQGWRLDIAPADLSLNDYSGRWNVRIADLYPNNTSNGIFHGWAMTLQGLR